jgi:hypothetical protein
MYYDQHKKRNPESALVYIERYNRANGTVLMDFINSEERSFFLQNLNLVPGNSLASMIMVSNYFGKIIRQNTVYSINRSKISQLMQDQLISVNDNSFLIGFNIELNDNAEELFDYAVSIRPSPTTFNFLIATSPNTLHTVPQLGQPTTNIKVIVRNVGQGNWNEIYENNHVKLVYDVGAPLLASISEVRTIIGKKPTDYSTDRPGIILSHWDVDHYHSLVGMTDAELACFSFFICRDILPNTTAQDLFARITAIIGLANIFCLSQLPRVQRSPVHLIPHTPLSAPHILFNSEYHKNRNKSGLVLLLRTHSSSLILSGDVHYEQLSADVLPSIIFGNTNGHVHNLIAPHHGGLAGDYVYALPNGVITKIAAISVGVNPWGHPYGVYTNGLSNSGFTVVRTDRVGDITINL